MSRIKATPAVLTYPLYKRTMHQPHTPLIYLLVWRLVLFATPTLILVDSINGYLIREFHVFGLSKIIKSGFLLLLLVLAARSKSGLILVSTCITATLTFIIVHFVHTSNIEAISTDAEWLLRLNIIFIGFHVFFKMKRDGILNDHDTYRIFLTVSLILAANLIIGLAGYGYSQYGRNSDFEADKIGAVGYIYSGNEMSFLMLICQIMVCSHLFFNKKYRLYYIWSISFIFLSAIKATKVSILGSLILTIIFPFIESFQQHTKINKGKSGSIIILIITVALVILSLPHLFDLINKIGLLDRFIYFFNERGLLFLILSGREEYSKVFIYDLLPRFSALELLVGIGPDQLENEMGFLTETDALDVLGSFGIAGIFFFFGLYVRLLIKLMPRLVNRKHSFNDRTCLILILFLILTSLTAGHVVYSGLAAPYIALALGTLITKEHIPQK